MSAERTDAVDRLGTAFDLAVTGMTAVDLHGRYIRVNRRFCELLGRSEEELLELSWSDVTHPDDLGASESLLSRVAEGEWSGPPIEKRYIRPDGSMVWALLVYELVRDEGGDPLFLFTQVLDITDRKREEDGVLEMTREQLAEAQEIARLGSYEWDAATNSVTWSDELARVFGFEKQKTITIEELIDRVHPDDRQFLLVAEEDRETSGSVEREVRILRPDGSVRWMQVRGRRYSENGRLVRVVGTALDITERKEAEQALLRSLETEREAVERLQALDRSKNMFLTSISHEIRTPLTAIAGYARILQTEWHRLTEEQRNDFLERTGKNADQLENLLTDLLDIDRLASGVLEPRRRETDLAELVDAAIERSSLPERTTVIVDHRGPVVGDVDPAWTERIVANMISNVLKHTPEGTRTWVRTYAAEGHVCIEIEDDGPGMDEVTRAQAFDPFTHGPTAPQHSPGAGIGLPLVKQLAELQGGAVSIADGSQNGVRFTVRLPAAG